MFLGDVSLGCLGRCVLSSLLFVADFIHNYCYVEGLECWEMRLSLKVPVYRFGGTGVFTEGFVLASRCSTT